MAIDNCDALRAGDKGSAPRCATPFVDRLYQIKQPQRVVDTLHLDNVELVMARHFGRILYVEGKTT